MRKQVLSLCSTVVLIALSIPAAANSRYLTEEKNAIGIYGGVASTDDSSEIGFGIGLSIRGQGDVSIGFSSISFDQKLYGAELYAFAFDLGVALYPIKQSNQNPFSLALKADAVFVTYVSDVLDFYGLEMSATGWSIGIAMLRMVTLTETSALQPCIGISFFQTTVTLEDSFGNSLKDKDFRTRFYIDCALLFRLESKSILSLKPFMLFTEEITAAGITIGFTGYF